MKIITGGIVIKRSNGIYEFAYWALEGIGSPADLTPANMDEMIFNAKSHGVYIENDELTVTEFYRLVVAKAKEEVYQIGHFKRRME